MNNEINYNKFDSRLVNGMFDTITNKLTEEEIEKLIQLLSNIKGVGRKHE